MKEKIEASEIINRFKKPLLNFAVIIVAFIISLKIYSGQEKNINSLKKQKADEIKRNQALEDIAGLEMQLGSYKNFLNKKDIDSSIKKLGAIAKASSVKIISIRPEGAKDADYYVIYPFSLTVTAKDYHSLGRFIGALENDADLYTVNSLNVKEEGGSARQEGAGLQAGIQVSTILYKD